jgi:hypothetical protein
MMIIIIIIIIIIMIIRLQHVNYRSEEDFSGNGAT